MDKDMDDFETASLEGGPVPLYPLYSVNPQPNSRTDNLSCSKNYQFCYLCQYTQETGLATDIRDHIRVLARRGYELPRIVAAVSRIYKNELKRTPSTSPRMEMKSIVQCGPKIPSPPIY